MKSIDVAVLACSALFVSAVGCASDPAQRVTKAEKDRDEAIAGTEQDRIRMEAEQAKDHSSIAEHHVEQDVDLDKSASGTIADKDAAIVKAQANLAEQREKAKIENQARIAQLEALLATARARVDQKQGAKQQQLRADITALERTLSTARQAAAAAAAAADSTWFKVNTNADELIDKAEERGTIVNQQI